jgi:hypothetical protein
VESGIAALSAGGGTVLASGMEAAIAEIRHVSRFSFVRSLTDFRSCLLP